MGTGRSRKIRLTFLLPFFLGAACAGSGASSTAGNCEGKTGDLPFDGVLDLEVGGRSRQALVHVPSSVNSERPASLHLSFHGTGATSLAQAALTGFNDLADSEGSIVVYPQAVERPGSLVYWEILGEEDLAFVDALVAEIESAWCIDARRVYASGVSNGGIFTYRMACERAGTFAAVAPVSSGPLPIGCDPSRPVPAIVFAGADDPLVPPQSTQGASEDLARINGCTREEPLDGVCTLHTGCTAGADVLFCLIPGMGHIAWPGGVGNQDGPIDGTAEIGDFFEAHSMP